MPLEFLAYAAALVLFAVRLATIGREITSREFQCTEKNIGWGIHHDEKFTAHDGKIFAGLAAPGARLADYRYYPVSAAFGLGGPLLTAAGFRLFGVTNRGLRLLPSCLATLADLLFLRALFLLLPPLSAAGFALVYLANFHNFVYARHGVLEHLLMAVLLGVFVGWLEAPAWILAHAGGISFVLGWLVVVKWSFPAFANIFLGGLLLASGAPLAAYVAQAVFGGAGLLLALAVHLLLLRHYRLLDAYLLNIKTVFFQHSGKGSLAEVTFEANKPAAIAMYWRKFLSYCFGLFEVHTHTGLFVGLMLVLTGLLAATLAHGAGLAPVARRVLVFSLLWHLFHFVIFYKFFFYHKRIVTLLPFSFLTVGLAWGGCGLDLTLPGGLFLVFFLLRQCQYATEIPGLPEDFLDETARQLTAAVPPDEPLYVHGLAFRMLWRDGTHRVIAYDEQFKWKNEAVIDWAVRENARWIVLPMIPERLLPTGSQLFLRPTAQVTVPAGAEDEETTYWLYEVLPPHHRPGRAASCGVR